MLRSVTTDELRELLAFQHVEPQGWAGVIMALRLIIKQNYQGLLGVKDLDLDEIMPGWRPPEYDEEIQNRKAWQGIANFFRRSNKVKG